MNERDGTILIEGICVECGEHSFIRVPLEGYKQWLMGRLIQDAFPDLTPGQRETLISGVHEACFDKMWAKEQEELRKGRQ